jgi:hypothetical protein
VANTTTTTTALATMVIRHSTKGLQQLRRWQRAPTNLQPGDFILLREKNMTSLHWPTAVITDIHPQADGIFRVVTLRNTKGIQKSHYKNLSLTACE